METWLKAHERFIVVIGVLVLVYLLVGRVETVWDNHLSRQDAATLLAAKDTLAKQQVADAQLVKQNKSLAAQIAAAEKQFTSTKQQAVQIPHQIAAIPVSDLQTDIELKLNGPLTSTPVLRAIDTDITDYPLMTQELDEINSDLNDTQQQNKNLTLQIGNLNSQLTASANVCKTEIESAAATQKAKDHKHLRLMEKIAAIAGAVAGGFIGHGI